MIQRNREQILSPQAATADHERFRLLVTGIRREYVTYALVTANVAVFIAMVASGVSFSSPTAADAIRWGASSGLYTSGGDFWRLYTANYVHFGIVHIAFNMYVLYRAGPLTERMFGHAGFLIGYAFAGFAGSVASVLWNDPMVASAGASGAVFGVFGMIGGFLLRRGRVIPPPLVKALRNHVIGFIVFNVAFALMVRGLDQAAHLGGLAGGFAVGALLAPQLTDAGGRHPLLLYPIPIAAMVAVTLAFALGAFASL